MMTSWRPISYQNRIRGSLVIGCLIYGVLYRLIYIDFLYPRHGYLGFNLYHPGITTEFIAILLCTWPGFLLEANITRPSQVITWMLYITVYVPSMWVPIFANYRPNIEVVQLCFMVSLGFFVILLFGRFKLMKIHRFQIARRSIKVFNFIIIFILYLWVFTEFRDHLNLSSFADAAIRELRDQAREIQTGNYVRYAVAILSGSVNPILMAIGLVKKRYLLFILGFAGQVFLYSTAAMKSILISPIVILLFFFLGRKNKELFGPRLLYGTIVLFSLLLLSIHNNANSDEISIGGLLLDLLFMRTIGIPGLVTGMYHEFFHHHPYTYFSHVKFINYFIHYPFQGDISQEVGIYFYGYPGPNMTAHLWATDGFGSMGLFGVVFISFICGYFIYLLDSVAKRHNILEVALAISFGAMSLADNPFFTTLLSGGLIFCLGYYWITPVPSELASSNNRKNGE